MNVWKAPGWKDSYKAVAGRRKDVEWTGKRIVRTINFSGKDGINHLKTNNHVRF